MSASREKDQKDYDLEQLIQVIDSALTSDNAAVQNALRSLLLISTIVSAEHPDQVLANGPLSRMYDDVRHLARRLGDLENEVSDLKRTKLNAIGTPYNNIHKSWDSPWPAAGDDTGCKGPE
jgi:hypothetical protein